MSEMERMKQLVEQLDAAARAYYQENRELMSNQEYDQQYDELLELERSTGTVLAKSPTLRAGYEVLSELPKEAHPSPMLSLDKTKEVAQLQEFLGEQSGLLSWKLDGLTIVLTYEGGQLSKAVTRGNGLIGEVVTSNARQFKNLPARIPFLGHLVLRGEAVISYSDFQRMNEELEEEEARYKNPRNLCAGSVRQLNSEVTAGRHVQLYAFALIEAEEEGQTVEFKNSHEEQLKWLRSQGFSVVPYRRSDAAGIPEAVAAFSEEIMQFDIPSDGLVLLMDDIAYGEELGSTAKFPRNSMAFKWRDELAETVLREMEWSASRTGLINPVAIFDPVQLEGTTVSRASVHNLSVLEGLKLGIGDRITVYKANMIIPQIAENLTESGSLPIPEVCPVCHGRTEIRQNVDVRVLTCPNPDCAAKQVKAFQLMASRDALNIDGLSEATMEKLIAADCIHEFADLFQLEQHRDTIRQLEGFGEKSCDNLLRSIENARHTTLSRVIYALGIPGIGAANAKLLAREFHEDMSLLLQATQEELTQVEGIGPILAEGIADFFQEKKNRERVEHLLQELILEKEKREDSSLQGLVFVVTGAVHRFENRNALKKWVEDRGGKVTGSVTSKTTALVNNDAASASSKNKKAKELGIPILSEEEFLETYDLKGAEEENADTSGQ